jgi:hypothetical protein
MLIDRLNANAKGILSVGLRHRRRKKLAHEYTCRTSASCLAGGCTTLLFKCCYILLKTRIETLNLNTCPRAPNTTKEKVNIVSESPTLEQRQSPQ